MPCQEEPFEVWENHFPLILKAKKLKILPSTWIMATPPGDTDLAN